jgi:Protein of unknown function (DUF2752)
LIRDAEWRRRRRVANALLVAGVAVGAALLVWPPGPAAIYPVCPVRALVGIECPGCGATRALAALLHGQVGEAMRLNALFVLLLPFALGGAVESYRRAILPGSFRWPQPPAVAIYATLAAAVAFTVARNVL